MARRHVTEARDTNGRGFVLNRFLIEFNLARDLESANNLIRTGAIELDNQKIKDILHIVGPGSYGVRIHGDFMAEVTIL